MSVHRCVLRNIYKDCFENEKRFYEIAVAVAHEYMRKQAGRKAKTNTQTDNPAFSQIGTTKIK